MKVNKLRELFGEKANPEREKAIFVQRINQSAFKIIEEHHPYEDTFKDVCYQLGLNADDLIAEANAMNYGSTYYPPLRDLTGDKFFRTLEVLVAAYDSLPDYKQERVDHAIKVAFAHAISDLGIVWKDGVFFPLGAKELDDKLIDDNLVWLKDFPETQKSFAASLERFARSKDDVTQRKDAITNAYTAVEAMAQAFLQNKKNFDSNSNEVVSKLGLPGEYRNIIHYYKLLANNYGSRHAGQEGTHEESEAFIYLTGLLLRLMVQKPH